MKETEAYVASLANYCEDMRKHSQISRARALQETTDYLQQAVSVVGKNLYSASSNVSAFLNHQSDEIETLDLKIKILQQKLALFKAKKNRKSFNELEGTCPLQLPPNRSKFLKQIPERNKLRSLEYKYIPLSEKMDNLCPPSATTLSGTVENPAILSKVHSFKHMHKFFDESAEDKSKASMPLTDESRSCILENDKINPDRQSSESVGVERFLEETSKHKLPPPPPPRPKRPPPKAPVLNQTAIDDVSVGIDTTMNKRIPPKSIPPPPPLTE